MKIKKVENVSQTWNPSFVDIKKWFDEKLHPDILDFNDQRVYKNVYHDGHFCATFQFTGNGAQRFIKKFKPVNLRDIAIATSIYRPGPLAAKVDALYLKAKENPEEAKKKEHPAVWKALESTYGCIIFQEALLKLAVDVAGFNPEESEKVRKTILKQSIDAKASNKEKREGKMRSNFIAGCMKTSGLTEYEGSELWEKVLFFCGYGFNATLSFLQRLNTYNANGEFVEETTMGNIQPGCYVKSRDEQTQQDIFVKVTNKFDHGTLRLFEITLDTGQKVKCSMNHKFRTMDGRMLPLHQILSEKLEIVAQSSDMTANDVQLT